MSAAEIIERATEDGVLLALLPSGSISAKGEQLAIDRWLPEIRQSKAAIVLLLRPGADGWSAEDWQTFINERAGIAEYDGGQSRVEAEAMALECCIVEWLNRNPQNSEPGRCGWCGQPDRNEHTVVPFGTAEHGHTWLHPECRNNWQQDRREMARQALERLGIRASVPDELQCGSNIDSE